MRFETTTLRSTLAALTRGHRGRVLATVSFGWLLVIGVRLVFPALLPSIRQAFSMDHTTAGFVVTVVWGGYAVTQFPGGMLADAAGERITLTMSTGIATAGVCVILFSSSVVAFFTGTFLFGAGTGLFGTTRITVLSDVFPDHDGAAIGVNQALGNVGTSLLPVAGGAVAVAAGWRWGFGFTVPLFTVAVVGLWLTVPARTSTPSDDESVLVLARHVAASITSRSVLLIASSMLLMSIVYQSFTGFYPTYLVEVKGLSEGTAATLFGLFFATAVVMQPIAGAASDRFGPRLTLAVFLTVTFAALVCLPFVSGLLVLVALTILLGMQLTFWTIANSYTVRVLPEKIQGTGFGLVRSTYLLLAASGPTFAGMFADAGLFDELFFLFAAITAGTLVLALQLPD